MKFFWQRFTAALTPGVRATLILLATVYLLALLGRLMHVVDLYQWLAASAPGFWHGQLWRVITYASLPAGFSDFAMNVLALLLLGSTLERHWPRGKFWLYCAMTATGAGMTAILLAAPLVGAAPMMFGLLVAWAFVCGHEIVRVPIFGDVIVWQMVLCLAALSLLIMAFSAGLTNTLIMASGGITGWLYLWLCHKWLMTRGSQTFQSERINRLEL